MLLAVEGRAGGGCQSCAAELSDTRVLAESDVTRERYVISDEVMSSAAALHSDCHSLGYLGEWF